MAQLTEQLGMVQRGRETMEPVRPAPSLFEALAGVVNTGIEMHQGATQVRTRRAAAERQAERDAREARDDAAENDAASAIIDVMRPSEMAAVRNAQGEAAQLIPLNTAVNQGRQTRDSMELRIEMRLRDLISRHPNSAAAIVQTFRENGLISPLMREYEEASEDLDDERDFFRENEQKLLDIASTTLGIPITADMTPQNRELALGAAREWQDGVARLDMLTKQASLQSTRRSMSREEERDNRETVSRNTYQAGVGIMGAELQAFQIAIAQIVADPGIDESEKQTRLQRLYAQIEAGATARKNEFLISGAGAQMSSEHRAAFESLVDDYLSSMRNMTIGESSVVNQRVRDLQLLQTRLGIQQHQLMPFYTQLRRVVGNDAVLAQLTQTITTNPEIVSRLNREMTGFVEASTNEQRQRINNVAAMLVDPNLNIREYGATEARRMLTQTLIPTVRGLYANRAARSGVDEGAHRSLLLGVMQISNAAVEAVPQWGVASLHPLISQTLTDQAVWDAMVTARANPAERELLQRAWFPALKQAHDAMALAQTGDRYYDVRFNDRNGMWEVVRNNTPNPQQSSTSLARFGHLPGYTPPRPSQATLNKMNSLNRAVNFMTNAGGRGLDEALPTQGVSAMDRRRFYGNNQLPAAVRQRQEAERTARRTTLENLDELERNAADWISRMPTVPEAGPIEEIGDHTETLNRRVQAAESNPATAPHVQAARSWAEQNGAPPDAIARLFAQESGYDNSARAGSGDREAIGVGQVTVRTARSYGVSRAQLEAMTPQQNMSLAFRILRDNFEATGNWEDAISMYHSGVTLSEARRQRRHDGNMSTSDYVEGILGG